MTHFARALGAARTGNPDAAKADIAKLAELRDKLREAKDAYWAEQVDIQWQVATAWVLYAEGKHDDALKAMSAAADAEDKTEKHPVTPGVPTPARELYGAMLLERGMAKEALAAFEATLKKEPHRLGATLGAAAAAEKAGRRREGASSTTPRLSRSRRMPIRSDRRSRRRGRSWRRNRQSRMAGVREDRREQTCGVGHCRRAGGRRHGRRFAGYSRSSHPDATSEQRASAGLDRSEMAVSRSINGERAVRLTARRPIAAPKLSSIFGPSSVPAIARTASQMTPTSIA